MSLDLHDAMIFTLADRKTCLRVLLRQSANFYIAVAKAHVKKLQVEIVLIYTLKRARISQQTSGYWGSCDIKL